MDALATAIEALPPGSRAPHIVSTIYGDDKLTQASKSVLADMFMVLYRAYTADGLLHVPPPDIKRR